MTRYMCENTIFMDTHIIKYVQLLELSDEHDKVYVSECYFVHSLK